MYDSQNGSGGSGVHRRFKKHGDETFSPSYGVRMGLIKDPNWPPPQFPDEGTAQNRRYRRVACEFTVRIGGVEHPTRGNLSLGGAMFQLPRQVESRTAEVLLNGALARAEVIEASTHGQVVAYRARFLDRGQAEAVWHAVTSAQG